MLKAIRNIFRKNHAQRPKRMVYEIQRSELVDEKTCEFCKAMDGVVLEKNHAWTKIEKFHKGCRGIWVEIMDDEVNPPKKTVMGKEDQEALLRLKRGQ